MSRRKGYFLLVGIIAVLLVIFTGGVASALPTGNLQITDPYDTTGDPAGGVTLPGLNTVTANNSPFYPNTEHDKSRVDNGAGVLGTDSNTGSPTSSGPHGR